MYTYNTNVLASVREALAQIIEEGLENVWKRHRKCSEKMWEGMEKLGITHFIKKPENRLHSLTTVVLPKDIEWPALYEYADKQ